MGAGAKTHSEVDLSFFQVIDGDGVDVCHDRSCQVVMVMVMVMGMVMVTMRNVVDDPER